MKINLFLSKKLAVLLVILIAFFIATPLTLAVYVCPTDNSKWPELGDCNMYCAPVSCVDETLNKHKECKNGACISVQGPGVDLCQSDEAFCRGKFCQNNACVEIKAPGPGGLSPAGQCKTNEECTHKYKCSGSSCVQDNANGTYTTSNCDNKCGGTTHKYKCSDSSCVQDDANGIYTTSNCDNKCGGTTGTTTITVDNPLDSQTFQDLIKRIAKYLFEIGIPIAVIMILYSAFLYMTAGGSPEKVSKAHKTLLYALAGLAILLLAWGLVSLVKELLGAT